MEAAWRRRRKRFTILVAASCVVLIPWTVFLALTLPRHYVASHWRLAWVGYDIALIVALALSAGRAYRRARRFTIRWSSSDSPE